jgi:hypothetical protein
VRSKLVLCIFLLTSPALGQTPPTATEAFDLRIRCKEMVERRAQEVGDQIRAGGKFAPEIEFAAHNSRYDPKANRCYGEFIEHDKIKVTLQKRESRVLYDMQIDDLLADTKIQNGKKWGMVFDHSHQITSDSNLGWDDANAYIDKMMTEDALAR